MNLVSIKDFWEKIKPFYLPTLLVLVAIGSYGLGRLSKLEEGRDPVRIEMLAEAELAGSEIVQAAAGPSGVMGRASVAPAAAGMVMASKSGTRYYWPWCSGVKRIKEENLVTYKSVAEAEAKGLSLAKNCK